MTHMAVGRGGKRWKSRWISHIPEKGARGRPAPQSCQASLRAFSAGFFKKKKTPEVHNGVTGDAMWENTDGDDTELRRDPEQ